MRLNFRAKRTHSLAPEFIYPFEPAPRVLLLGSEFRQTERTRVMPVGTCLDLSLITQDTIAAPVWRLRELAAQKVTMRYPLVAFTGEFSHLTSADRDLFWESFGVPVFEQLVNAAGHVIADECEAHTALHVRVPKMGASLANCACGRSGVFLDRTLNARRARA
jgi:hypothetical protein